MNAHSVPSGLVVLDWAYRFFADFARATGRLTRADADFFVAAVAAFFAPAVLARTGLPRLAATRSFVLGALDAVFLAGAAAGFVAFTRATAGLAGSALTTVGFFWTGAGAAGAGAGTGAAATGAGFGFAAALGAFGLLFGRPPLRAN